MGWSDIQQIEIVDPMGMIAAKYLKLADDCYFGGVPFHDPSDKDPIDFSPHVWHQVDSLLTVIMKAALRNESLGGWYARCGNIPNPAGTGKLYQSVALWRHGINVNVLAQILGCEPGKIHDKFSNTITPIIKEESKPMSGARWCDFGDHAYKEGREGTIILGRTEQVPNQWGGQQPSTTPNLREICPECAASIGLNDDYTKPEQTPEERKALLAKAAKTR